MNQAVKAFAIARGYVAPRGINLDMRPGFMSVKVDDAETGVMSAINLIAVVS